MSEPLISVIVPVYNVEEYLQRCVESLLAQDYSNIQIVLVDDGSPDKCGDICDEYSKTYPNIMSLHKRNGGASDARNYGLKYAKGRYICFVDSDDYVTKHYISHLYTALVKTKADLSMSWFCCVYNSNGKKTSDRIQDLKIYTAKECIERLLYQDGVDTSPCGKLYKKELLGGLEFPKGKLYEDIPFTSEAILRSEYIAVISNVDYFYFQRNDSTQYQPFNRRKLDCIIHIRNMCRRVVALYPDLALAADCREFSALNNIFYQISEQKDDEIKNKIWNCIVKKRKNVLFNVKARKKARIAAALSFLGKKVISFVYHKTQYRGKMQ